MSEPCDVNDWCVRPPNHKGRCRDVLEIDCKHFHVGLDHDEVWFCANCGEPFVPQSKLQASVDAHNQIFEALRSSEEKLNAQSLRLSTYEKLLRDTLLPHGYCAGGACTHCDAVSALAAIARSLPLPEAPK